MPNSGGSYTYRPGSIVSYTVIDGVTSEPVTEDAGYSPGSWSRQSTNTPGFYKGFRSGSKRVKPVDLPMNGFRFTSEKTIHPVASKIYEVRDNGRVVLDVEQGTMKADVMIPPSSAYDFDKLNAKAASKMLSGLKDQTVNVAVAVAEGRKSLDMIAKTAVALAEAGFAVKKADFSGAARALGVPLTRTAKKNVRSSNSVSSNWLALQYGWLPLLSDIHGAAEFVAKTMDYHPRSKMTSSSTSTDAYRRSYTQNFSELTDAWTLTHTVKYVVYFTEQGGGNPPTALGLTNPLAVAWELVPFSFVVDWFLPVGTFINNLDATNSLVFVKGCRTEFRKYRATRYTGTHSEVIYAGRTDTLYAGYQSVSEGVFCERLKLNDFPLNPVPMFKNPLSGRKGDFAHELNAMALLTQAFTRGL
jgi:hypothetical protein